MDKLQGLAFIFLGGILALSYQNFVEYHDEQTRYQNELRFYRLLETHKYSVNYAKHVFDCSQMSVLLESFMESHGYPSHIVVTDNKTSTIEHAYVVSLVNEDWLTVEPTCSPLKRIGCVKNYTLQDVRLFANLSDAMQYNGVDVEMEWVTDEKIVVK